MTITSVLPMTNRSDSNPRLRLIRNDLQLVFARWMLVALALLLVAASLGVAKVPIEIVAAYAIALAIRLAARLHNHVTSLVEDQTERQRALESVQRELDEANREIASFKEQLEDRVKHRTADLAAFTYAVSHDLRAPLRAIDAFAGLIAMELGRQLTPGIEHLVNRIHEGVHGSEQMISRLLNFAAAGSANPRLEHVDMSTLARSIVEELRVTEPDRYIQVEIAPEVSATADRVLTRQLLQNLLGNAWKFTAKKAKGCIRFGAHCENGATVYFVSDNGVGFDPAAAKDMFQVFQRLHAAAEFTGTGIGLATANRIVQRHGGRIWAEAKPQGGATFFFTLPEERRCLCS